jgi:hypothetical protein
VVSGGKPTPRICRRGGRCDPQKRHRDRGREPQESVTPRDCGSPRGSTGGRTDGPRLGFFASVPPQPRANTLVRCIWSEGYSKKGQDHARKCLKALLASAAASVRAASAPCPDPGAICNIQCYNSPYCSIWRACWVTASGIGVCSPVHYGRAPRYPRLDGTWLNARTVARVRRWIAEHGSQHLLRSPQAPTRAARSGAISLVRPVARPQRSLPG